MKRITTKHFYIELPDGWHIDCDDVYSLYSNSGDGALTISSLSLVSDDIHSLEERVCIMARQFIREKKIIISGSLMLEGGENVIVYGKGKTPDNWFVRIWIIAKGPRVLVSTFYSRKNKRQENNECNKIIESIKIID